MNTTNPARAVPQDVPAPRGERLPLNVKGVALRAKTSTHLHRLVPTRLAVSRAERIGVSLWESDAEERAEAIDAMAVILGATALEARVEEFARDQVIERKAGAALFWQQWRAPLLDQESRARLLRAHAGGQGILLSSCHLRLNFLAGLALRELGIQLYTVFDDWFFAPPAPDLQGRRVERWRRGTASVPVRSRSSFESLRQLLEGGAAVLVMYDMPGPRATRFLGKPVDLADGTARLAVLTQAAVLPMHTRRVGATVSADVGAPIEQRHMGDAAAVHAQLAFAHERWILDQPATMHDPRAFGWGAGATASAWTYPQRREATTGVEPV
jgi:lauroyl/myristoyl acyltransferase